MSRSNSIDQIAQDLLTLHREQSVSRSFSSQYSASGAYNTSVVGSVSASNAFGSALAQGGTVASYSGGSTSGTVGGASGSVGSVSATYAASGSAAAYGALTSQSATGSNAFGSVGSVSNPFGSISGSATVSGSYGQFLSEIEAAVLRSVDAPIQVNETEELTVLGQRGIWSNKSEVVNWRGIIPISEYLINEDANPEIITKRVSQQLEYVQELAIRYLRPPTPPVPGEIVITQEPNTLTPPAPPLVIRQQPPRPDTPEPLIIREAPPQPPVAIGRKLITISGRRLPPPPRKVVIERLAPLPSKPQSVIVERWLPYNDNIKRRVVFQRAPADPVIVRPRNVIVQWEAPSVAVRKEYKYLGVVRANPVEYVQRYGSSLKVSRDLPQFILDIKTPEGLVLAANYAYNTLHELEGDVEALKLVDLEREGLGEYRAYLQRLFGASSSSATVSSSSVESIIEEIFRSIDTDNTGSIDIDEASRVVLRLNSRLGRSYGEDEVKAFFAALDTTQTKTLSLDEFKKAFFSL